MSRIVLSLLSFILGGSIGFILMACIVIGKEGDKYEKDKKNK